MAPAGEEHRPMLAANAVREAGADKTIYGVARFSDPSVAEQLENAGIVPVTADVNDESQLATLPDAKTSFT
jgi:hypothetical protein